MVLFIFYFYFYFLSVTALGLLYFIYSQRAYKHYCLEIQIEERYLMNLYRAAFATSTVINYLPFSEWMSRIFRRTNVSEERGLKKLFL